jgi:hypothetical protein
MLQGEHGEHRPQPHLVMRFADEEDPDLFKSNHSTRDEEDPGKRLVELVDAGRLHRWLDRRTANARARGKPHSLVVVEASKLSHFSSYFNFLLLVSLSLLRKITSGLCVSTLVG